MVKGENHKNRLQYYDIRSILSNLSPLKSVGLHKLSGDRADQWAMTVNGPWRICFRDLCKTSLFVQSLCQAQILILEILNVFLWLKSSSSLTLNKNEHFSKVYFRFKDGDAHDVEITDYHKG